MYIHVYNYTGMPESVNVSRELFPSDENCQEEIKGGGEGVKEGRERKGGWWGV